MIPRTLTGKRLEVPIKRVMLGSPISQGQVRLSAA
jgi:hypothetical protein